MLLSMPSLTPPINTSGHYLNNSNKMIQFRYEKHADSFHVLAPLILQISVVMSITLKLIYLTRAPLLPSSRTLCLPTQDFHVHSKLRRCNIRPENTYRRKIKLGPKTTGQRLNRALHVFHRLYQSQFFWWSFSHRVDKNVTVLRHRPERSS